MPRDGTGTYNAPESPAVTATPITASGFNATISDLGSALTQSLSRDGQTVPGANLPMGTFKHTGVGNATARNEYAALGQVQDGAVLWGGTAGGTANALTLTLAPVITAYAAGQQFRFLSGAANTAAATIAINALTAQSINKGDGLTALAAGDIPAGHMITVQYDGTRFRLLNVQSAFGASLAASPDAAAARATLGGTTTGIQVFTAATATDARTALSAPANPTGISGLVGEWRPLSANTGLDLVMPAGGVWAGHAKVYDNSNVFSGVTVTAVAAGGTVISAGLAGFYHTGFCWRIA